MELNFIGKNLDVTPALKTFITEKLKPLEKRYTHINSVNVVFHIERDIKIAEATLLFNGVEIHATAKDNDMYKAIDALADKLLGLVTKHKEKLIDSHR